MGPVSIVRVCRAAWAPAGIAASIFPRAAIFMCRRGIRCRRYNVDCKCFHVIPPLIRSLFLSLCNRATRKKGRIFSGLMIGAWYVQTGCERRLNRSTPWKETSTLDIEQRAMRVGNLQRRNGRLLEEFIFVGQGNKNTKYTDQGVESRGVIQGFTGVRCIHVEE